MKKPQWRMLMSTILDIHNDARALEERQVNWVKGFADRLAAIERRLPPEPPMDIRTYEIMPDGTQRECEE